MLDRDLVVAKLASLERCLARVQDAIARPGTGLTEIDRQDIAVLNLQRAIQATIDLAAHVVARENLGVPDSLGSNFTLMEQAGVLRPELAERMRRMTGFRNVAVHEYRRLDPAVLAAVVRNRLGDLRSFAALVLARAGLS